MSLATPVPGEVFTVRIYKHLDIAVSQFWSNTYELEARSGSNQAALTAAAMNLLEMERLMALDTSQFDRVIVSTYVPDGAPYDPTTFVSIPRSDTGDVGSGAADVQLPLNVVLYIRRDVASGRTGKLYLRNCLEETDVRGRFGDVQLEAAATLQANLTTALASSGADDLLVGGGGDFQLVMASGNPASPSTRPITGLTVASGRIVKFNNRYFDVP